MCNWVRTNQAVLLVHGFLWLTYVIHVVGTPELVADLPEELLISAENKMKEIVENAIDAMKLSPEPVCSVKRYEHLRTRPDAC